MAGIGTACEPDGRPSATNSMVSRVFGLLRAFSDSRRAEFGLTELASHTGFPKSTVHRIVRQLVEQGALERTGHGYRLGLQMFEIGSLVPFKRRLREAALPFIEDLYEGTHETIHFGVLDSLELLYLERINGHDPVACRTRMGGRMPAHCTGLGKALLAAGPAETIEEVIAAGLSRHTPHTITYPKRFRDHLRTVSEEGVAFDREEAVLGVACVAAPVRNRAGHPVAAISVTTTPTAPPERFVPAVQRTAERLSAAVCRRPDSFWHQPDLGADLPADRPQHA